MVKVNEFYSTHETPMIPAFVLASLPDNLLIDKMLLQAAHAEELPVSIRRNPCKLPVRTGIPEPKLNAVPWCEQGFYLPQRPSFTADPLFHAGAYYVQEASSMFLEQAIKQWAPLHQPLLVADLCASPGGKSTHLASLLHPESILVSNEIVPNRVATLVENAVKWGHANHWVSHNDTKAFAGLPNFFDVVIVDAPCSGSGLFRKMPNYANEIKPEHVTHCHSMQKEIVGNAYHTLAHNGILVYMTCSFSSLENEDMLDYMLQEFDLEPLPLQLQTSWGIVESRSHTGGIGYRFFPHLIKGEGFFLSCFKKKGEGNREHIKPYRSAKTTPLPELPIKENIPVSLFPIGEDWGVVLESHRPVLEYLQKKLRLVKRGTVCGTVIRNQWIPHHEWAMSNLHAIPENQMVELTVAEALTFLKKENLHLPLAPLGWVLVRFQNLALGWVKNLGHRSNNYYPATYKIINKNIG